MDTPGLEPQEQESGVMASIVVVVGTPICAILLWLSGYYIGRADGRRLTRDARLCDQEATDLAIAELEALHKRGEKSEEEWHELKDRVADLVIKHRDEAEAQLAVAREALEPFVIACSANTVGRDPNDLILQIPMTVGHLRKARAALAQISPAAGSTQQEKE
jgi:hypothetical protein